MDEKLTVGEMLDVVRDYLNEQSEEYFDLGSNKRGLLIIPHKEKLRKVIWMEKIIKVGSYAEAEGIGIKPVDSIISVGSSPVFFKKKKNPPYTVVGFTKGWTFKEGEVEFPKTTKHFLAVVDNKIMEREYPEIDISDLDYPEIEISATNKNVAKKITESLTTFPYKLYERKLQRVI